MTAAQIILVKKTWGKFRGVNPVLIGDTFYSKLFYENPSLKKMFPEKMEAQYQKLVDMLSTIIARLDNIAAMHDKIIDMAKRHTKYGVKPHHYDSVGIALLWTLKQGLGNDWTKETEEAWTVCYNVLVKAMIEAQ